jgi:hypothetical protein
MNVLTYNSAENRSILKVHPKTKEEGINHGKFYQMAEGILPDLREFCLTLAESMSGAVAPTSAKEFVPELDTLPELDENAIKGLLKSPETRHVLVSGERLEIVLNLWKPGKASDIHGHPSGGCLFTLLYGKAEEVRYSPQSSKKLLGFASYRPGDMAYIDDGMAFHQVGNPYGRPALSIHIYLKKSY